MMGIGEEACVCHVILRGKADRHLFEEEVQKKRFLDTAAGIRESGVQILSYCVLDNEVQLLLKADGVRRPEELLQSVKRRWEESCAGRGLFRRDIVKELHGQEALLRCSVRIHLLPVKRAIVCHPEDYWWCSYRDYMGRKWGLPVQTQVLLAGLDGDDRRAARMFKQAHRRYAEKLRGA